MTHCKDCRFCHWPVGQCRAHPPNWSLKYGWPNVAATDWCGEGKPKTQSIRAIVVSYREGQEAPWRDAQTHEWTGNNLVLRAIKAMKPRVHQDGDKNTQVQTKYVTENCLEWRIRMVEVQG